MEPEDAELDISLTVAAPTNGKGNKALCGEWAYKWAREEVDLALHFFGLGRGVLVVTYVVRRVGVVRETAVFCEIFFDIRRDCHPRNLDEEVHILDKRSASSSQLTKSAVQLTFETRPSGT